MPAIDQEYIDEFFGYVQKIRDGLPLIESVAEAIDPALVPEIELVKLGQGKLFEVLSRLQSANAVALEAEKAALRDETIATWRAGRG